MPRIGVIGEHDPSNPTHVATDDALGRRELTDEHREAVSWRTGTPSASASS